jgi:hypothetical protein
MIRIALVRRQYEDSRSGVAEQEIDRMLKTLVIHSSSVLLTSLEACRTELCVVAVGAHSGLATSSNRTIENPFW